MHAHPSQNSASNRGGIAARDVWEMGEWQAKVISRLRCKERGKPRLSFLLHPREPKTCKMYCSTVGAVGMQTSMQDNHIQTYPGRSCVALLPARGIGECRLCIVETAQRASSTYINTTCRSPVPNRASGAYLQMTVDIHTIVQADAGDANVHRQHTAGEASRFGIASAFSKQEIGKQC